MSTSVQQSAIPNDLVNTDRAAQIVGTSRLRVQQMIERGQLPATRVSGHYMLRLETLRPRSGRGRPLSHEAAWDVLHLAAGHHPGSLAPRVLAERQRQLEGIAYDEDPALRARTLLSRRGRRRFFASLDPSTLLEDDRVVVAGAWHTASGISSVPASALSELCIYVHPADLDDVVALHMLSEDVTRGTIVIAQVTATMPSPEIMPAVVAVDLAESLHPREQQVARTYWARAGSRGRD